MLPVLFACSLASGALLPIEQIQVGDQVVAPTSLENPREYAPFEVLETPRRTVAEVLDVVLEHEDGRRELLTATDEHPFAVERAAGPEWVDAGELRAGDRVVADEGAATVQSVARRVAPTEVFNLVVESAHAYLVGDGVLVHNGNGCEPKAGSKPTGSYTVKFDSGKKYHGKGPEQRAVASARREGERNSDPVVEIEWKPEANQREAFKAEARRIRKDGGVDPGRNYNRVNSPGEKYLREDGG